MYFLFLEFSDTAEAPTKGVHTAAVEFVHSSVDIHNNSKPDAVVQEKDHQWRDAYSNGSRGVIILQVAR